METAQMRRLNLCRLAWTFAVHLCVKYPFLMSWFSMLEEIYTALMRFELEYSKTNTMTYTQREDSDQLGYRTGLIRVIAGYSMDSQWLGTAKTLIKLCRFQAHQSLCWMYMSFCSFFWGHCGLAQFCSRFTPVKICLCLVKSQQHLVFWIKTVIFQYWVTSLIASMFQYL